MEKLLKGGRGTVRMVPASKVTGSGHGTLTTIKRPKMKLQTLPSLFACFKELCLTEGISLILLLVTFCYICACFPYFAVKFCNQSHFTEEEADS